MKRLRQCLWLAFAPWLLVGVADGNELSSASYRLVGPTLSAAAGDLQSDAAVRTRGSQGVTVGESGPVGRATGPASGIVAELGFWPVANAFMAAGDGDRDGVADSQDNCLVAPNSDQLDSDADGIGDACECGDFNLDGRVTTVDARLIQRCVVGQIACAGLCDTTGDGVCSTIDARLIQRLAVQQLTKDDLSCVERP